MNQHLVWGAMFLCTVPALQAQGGQPACSAPEYRQFDFWIGEWDVQDTTGKPVGINVIRKVQRGCILHENWTSLTSAHAGNSYNIYDALEKVWHQTWVDNSGLLLQLDGRFQDGKMVLAGERLGRNGQTVEHRITWSELEKGNKVRQFWETSTDGGQTWSVAFDGIYIRR